MAQWLRCSLSARLCSLADGQFGQGWGGEGPGLSGMRQAAGSVWCVGVDRRGLLAAARASDAAADRRAGTGTSTQMCPTRPPPAPRLHRLWD
jgi:hypothetical protein